MSHMQPVILGINAVYHESSSCIVMGSQLRAIAEEERFNRVKHGKAATVDNADVLPLQSISHCMAKAGIKWRDITHIAYSFDPALRPAPIDEPRTPMSWATPEGEAAFIEGVTQTPQRLSELAGFDVSGRFSWIPHELSHAASAYYPSGYPDSAILCADGIGEWSTGLLARGDGRKVDVIEEIHYPNSLGFLWEKFAKFVGLGEYDAPKVMALAAFSEPGRFAEAFGTFLLRKDSKFEISLDTLRFRVEDYSRLEALFGPRKKRGDFIDTRDAEVASALQSATESVLLDLARLLKDATDSDNLCLAGGVALNCVANGQLAKHGPFRNIFVQPLAHDGGTALGAALRVAHDACGIEERHELVSPYLGPDFSEADVLAALRESGMRFRRLASPAATVAELLTVGRVGGWFQGAAEIGPRALGNRSIVADPRRPGSRELINLRIKQREYFRPFAPSILNEEAEDWFEIHGRSRSQSFMSFAFNVRPEKQHQVPAILHVDGTSRLQRVAKSVNPRYHALIEQFYLRTGVPMILNTSFNTYDEPIVLSPKDAIRTYIRTGMDFLAIGDFIASRVPFTDDGVRQERTMSDGAEPL